MEVKGFSLTRAEQSAYLAVVAEQVDQDAECHYKGIARENGRPGAAKPSSSTTTTAISATKSSIASTERVAMARACAQDFAEAASGEARDTSQTTNPGPRFKTRNARVNPKSCRRYGT